MDLTSLIETYRGPLIGLIASWGVPWGDATEIAEESFATAWLNRAACRGDWTDPEVVGHWLRGVARNRYQTWARGRWRWRARFVAFDPATLEALVAPESPGSEPSNLVDQVRRVPGPGCHLRQPRRERHPLHRSRRAGLHFLRGSRDDLRLQPVRA